MKGEIKKVIYITGDTHGDFSRFGQEKLFVTRCRITAQDYVIVCGDFGLLWKRDAEFERRLKFLEGLKFTVLWVQGNHENYDMIAEYPLEEWHGGMARHILRDKVILLERGQIFTIEGKKFFTFGGASSHDVKGIRTREEMAQSDEEFGFLYYRVQGVSGWRQELPSEEEMQEGIRNLKKEKYHVDYVITHCLSGRMLKRLRKCSGRFLDYPDDRLTDYFDRLEKKLRYKRWYCGHYHVHIDIDNKHTVLYHEMIKLDENEETRKRNHLWF